MGRVYCLRGAVGTGDGVRRLANMIGDTVVVPLRQGFFLVPITDTVFTRVTGTFTTGPCSSDVLPEPLRQLLEAASADGAIAYLEADFFGGDGDQVARVWKDGKLVFGPVWLDDAPGAGTPISQALREMGVVRDSGVDEFDAVRLGWQRETENWLDRRNWPGGG
jgi:hypothetical protein